MGRAVDTEEENGGAAGGKSASGDVVASYLPLVDFLAEVLGPTAEVVLHDLRRKGHSMVAIRNGELTGRRAGDATATEAALRIFHNVHNAASRPRGRRGPGSHCVWTCSVCCDARPDR